MIALKAKIEKLLSKWFSYYIFLYYFTVAKNYIHNTIINILRNTIVRVIYSDVFSNIMLLDDIYKITYVNVVPYKIFLL